MSFRACLLSLCLLSVPAWAAGQVDALRAQTKSLQEQVTSLRHEQLSRRNELSQLSARIETLKAEKKGALLGGGELDRALKQSQELSGSLTELAGRMSSREAELETAELALVDSLSASLSDLRARYDRLTDRGQRREVLEQMKALKSERERLRAALPAAKLPTLAVKPSDDPEELLEQADLLRDNEEKVRRELKALKTRQAEARQERELDRRVRGFLGEESMFDDQDRRLRLERQSLSSTPASPTAGTTGGTGTAPSSLGAQAGGADSNANGKTADTAPGGDYSGLRITTANDARPQVGGPRTISSGDEDSSDDFEVERLKMEELAKELHEKADALEKKAHSLE
jgi:prefoldin subunit 5